MHRDAWFVVIFLTTFLEEKYPNSCFRCLTTSMDNVEYIVLFLRTSLLLYSSDNKWDIVYSSYAGNHLNCGQNLTSCEGGQKNTGNIESNTAIYIAPLRPFVWILKGEYRSYASYFIFD